LWSRDYDTAVCARFSIKHTKGRAWRTCGKVQG